MPVLNSRPGESIHIALKLKYNCTSLLILLNIYHLPVVPAYEFEAGYGEIISSQPSQRTNSVVEEMQRTKLTRQLIQGNVEVSSNKNSPVHSVTFKHWGLYLLQLDCICPNVLMTEISSTQPSYDISIQVRNNEDSLEGFCNL